MKMEIAETVPISIWETILKQPVITDRDILSLTSTCKRFRDSLLNDSAIWRAKFEQKWPLSKKQLEDEFVNDWFDVYRHRHFVALETKNMLDALASRFIHQVARHLSDSAFAHMVNFTNQSEHDRTFLIDELRYILNNVPIHSRLTDKYYAAKAVRFLVKQDLIPKWRRWLDGNQLLEHGAWLFAQWFQPSTYLDESCLTQFLDKMVLDTKAKLMQTNKRHPLLKEDVNIDHHANLHESMWSPSQTREIIDALSFVFCTLHSFHGNNEHYYDLQNSFLNKVIETKLGLPITLCILYHAVARRLGVYCAPVNFPRHFILKFLDHPDLSESQQYTYIDVFNSCRLMRQEQLCIPASPNSRPSAHAFQHPSATLVILRMINNIASPDARLEDNNTDMVVCSAWELDVVLSPMEFTFRSALAHTYFRLDINTEKILDLMEDYPEPEDQLERILRQQSIEMARTRLLAVGVYDDDTSSNNPKLRSSNFHVKFAVGMIMRHKEYHYTCVITGWDPVCSAANSWKLQMGVGNLSRTDKQPFYHVLVMDGTERYAAEENMVFEPDPKPITHRDVGKFFQEYRGKYYKMNNERMKNYPEDEAAVLAYVKTRYRVKEKI